jgi:hypothetical protein
MGKRLVPTSSKDQPETKLTLVIATNIEKEYAVGKQAADYMPIFRNGGLGFATGLQRNEV